MRRLSIFKVGLIYISHSLKLCRVQKSSLLTSAMIWAKAGEAYRVEMTSPRSHSSLEENGTSHNSGVWIQSIPSPFGLDVSPCSPYRLPLPQKKNQPDPAELVWATVSRWWGWCFYHSSGFRGGVARAELCWHRSYLHSSLKETASPGTTEASPMGLI